MAERVWGAIVANVLPIVLAFVFSIIGFLALQVFTMKGDMVKEIAELKITFTEQYGELDKKLALNTHTIDDLVKTIDKFNGNLSSDEPH